MQAEVNFCDGDLTGFNILFTDTEPNTSEGEKKRCKNVEHMQSLWNGSDTKKRPIITIQLFTWTVMLMVTGIEKNNVSLNIETNRLRKGNYYGQRDGENWINTLRLWMHV